MTALIHESVVTAFKEDGEMVTAQAQNLALRPDFKLEAIRVDQTLSQYH